MSVRGWAILGRFLGWSWVLIGACSSETPPLEEPDATLPLELPECGIDRPCSVGRVCLSGRCFGACTADGQCSPREQCVLRGGQRGACVPRADAGLPPDPCADTACFGATPVCHPTAGVCVACVGEQHCAPETPICDRGRGVCVAGEGGLCAPCAVDADCGGGSDAGPGLSCVALDRPYEKVCLQSRCNADSDCPSAFECLPSLRVCTPIRGTCTSYRSATLERSCTGVEACSALDVPAGSPQAGVCHQGHCAFGCVATPDCPGARVCTPPVCERAGDAGTAALGL